MPRRGENIYKRKDGRWEGRWISGYDIAGKAKYSYVYAYSYSEVKTKLAGCKQGSGTSSTKHRSYKALNDYYAEWLESVRLKCKDSTVAKYESICVKHILPKSGKFPVECIKTSTVDGFLREKLEEGLSPRTVNSIKVILRLLMFHASTENSNCNFSAISVKQEWKQMRVLSTQEQQELCAFLKSDMDCCKLGVYLCLFTGLRIGEVCALQWKNIQLNKKILKVESTMQRIRCEGTDKKKTQIIITPPKSACSFREIPLTDALVNILSRYMNYGDAYLLTGTANRFIEPRTLQYRFKRYISLCGIADANYHSLRHTFATRCIEAGVDVKSLSEILGHANISVTLSRYVHSSMDWKRENMDKLTALL